MAAEPTDTRSQLERLRAAQQQVAEKNIGRPGGATREESGVDGQLRYSGVTTRPSGKAVERDFAGGHKRKGDTKGGNGYTPRPSGSDGESLGDGRKKYGLFLPTRGGTKGVDKGDAKTDRPSTWEKIPVVGQLGEWTQEHFKGLLAYAGFDVDGDADALTDKEVDQYFPKVVEFIQRVGMVLDWSITHSNKYHTECEIWTFEEAEAMVLAKIYMKRARRIGWMAQVARQVEHVSNVGDIGEFASIVGKRLVATGMFYPSNGGLALWLR